MYRITLYVAFIFALANLTLASAQTNFFETDLVQKAPIDKCGNADPAAARFIQGVLEEGELNRFAEESQLWMSGTAEYVQRSDVICPAFHFFARQHLNDYRAQQARSPASSAGHPDGFVYEYFRLGDVYAIVILETSETFEEQYDEKDLLTQVWPGRYIVANLFDQDLNTIALLNTYGEIVYKDEKK